MTPRKDIYLDNAATTRLSDPMQTFLISLLDVYGNPSSLHSLGEQAGQIIETARRSIAGFLHADPQDIYFTPSAAAGNTLAIKGLSSEDPHRNQYKLFYSPTAHKSMLKACRSCLCHTPLKVNPVGEIDLSALEDILTRHSSLRNNLKPLVCIEAANSEIGSINDVINIGVIVHKHNGILIVDATGYIPSYPVDIRSWQNYADIVTFSGHKLHALKGIGILWKHRNIRLKPLVYGSQEKGLLGGTENVLGIASLGQAVKDYDHASINSHNRDYLYDYIIHNIPDSYLIGPVKKRLPHNLYICFRGVEGESLMMLLDKNHIQVSTGSACNSGSLSASAALSAIGIDEEDAHSCIRFSFNGNESEEELDYVCKTLRKCVSDLRQLNTKQIKEST